MSIHQEETTMMRNSSGRAHSAARPRQRHGWLLAAVLTAIPAVGYDFSRHWGAQINVLGSAGLMFQLNYTMP